MRTVCAVFVAFSIGDRFVVATSLYRMKRNTNIFIHRQICNVLYTLA